MKIKNCPKGGKIPEGYCKQSCLNYSRDNWSKKVFSWHNLKNIFKSDGRSWLQIYKEDIALSKKTSCC